MRHLIPGLPNPYAPRLPGGFPADIRGRTLTLQGYGSERRLVAEERTQNGNVDDVIERLLGRSDVSYLHVRDTEAGCYDCRIERARVLMVTPAGLAGYAMASNKRSMSAMSL